MIASFRLYDPIPTSLCTHLKVNGGRTLKYGCDAILCPLGTFADHGLAADPGGCKRCPQGQTTIYLGSTECITLDQKDLLSMLFDVLDGDNWPDEFKKGWKEDKISVCEWAGVTCDNEHTIVGLSFPGSV
jgi:Leucine rich repeat N-terminal domain